MASGWAQVGGDSIIDAHESGRVARRSPSRGVPGSSGCGGWQVDGWIHLLSVNGKGSSRRRSYESLDMLLAARTTRRPPSSGGHVVRRTHPTESPVRWRLHRVWAMSHVGRSLRVRGP